MNLVNDDIQDVNSSSDSVLPELLHHLKNDPSDNAAVKILLTSFLNLVSKEKNSGNLKKLFSAGDYPVENYFKSLFPVLREYLKKCTDSWFIIESLFAVKNEHIIFMTADLLKELLCIGKLQINFQIIRYLADGIEIENSILSKPEVLNKLNDTFNFGSEDTVHDIYFNNNDIKCRIFAAKILDNKGQPASGDIIKKFLGESSYNNLLNYFLYTRISYLELLYLIPASDLSSPAAESVIACEKTCSVKLLKDVISSIGWQSFNYGLYVKKYTGLSLDGSIPLFVQDQESVWIQNIVEAEKAGEYFLFTAHGGLPYENEDYNYKNKPVALFRKYNLAHANLLKDLLDIAPLSTGKIINIIDQLDEIVNDFMDLFRNYSDECGVVSEIFNKIKNKILTELKNTPSPEQISADTTRLVQMFEDPHNIGEVHTLHGLKRYLHQKGLQLGFKLVDQSKSPNKNITLVLAAEDKILCVLKKINYAEFETSPETDYSVPFNIPYPVFALVCAFERQLLFGHETFPSVNIFCYANEVHYFVWFRNHPVFIRIDFSPPLQGGMIDLQYFGVSNYEIADHPNINLDAIRYFFRFLDFDVKMKGTHIQARYDKERAIDLNQLCEKAEYLFSLIPYLMDLDWIIGSLDISQAAKNKVIQVWTELFLKWGAIPVNKILTKNKLGILQEVINTPEGEFEKSWNGEETYKDLFSPGMSAGLNNTIRNSLRKLELYISDFPANPGQIIFEKKILGIIREALKAELIIQSSDGFRKVPEKIIKIIHEAVLFAELLNCRNEDYNASIEIAKILMPLEQTLKFQDSGTLGSFKVQRADLPLRGKVLKLFTLRDYNGILRMAFYCYSSFLIQKKKNDVWESNAEFSALNLMTVLRKNNYTIAGTEIPAAEKHDFEIINEELKIHRKFSVPHAGEKIIFGSKASPGRAAGRVLFKGKGKLPEDFKGHIFAAASVSPDDNTIIYNCKGIIATGGGILSHAGLIATQFNKPSLIITGEWNYKPDGSGSLLFRTSEYKTENKVYHGLDLSIYYDIHEHRYELKEGDMVILDASEGSLKVLGQDRDTLSLFEEFTTLGVINEILTGISKPDDFLKYRGKKIHIMHQLEKLIKRLKNISLAKYAVSEILTGELLEGNKCTIGEKSYLLNLLIKNDSVGKIAEVYLQELMSELESRFTEIFLRNKNFIPDARYPFEVVMPRLQVLQIFDAIKNISSLDVKIFNKVKDSIREIEEIEHISSLQLIKMREKIADKIHKTKEKEILRHLFRQFNRISLLSEYKEPADIKKKQTELHLQDALNLKNLRSRYVVKPGEGAHDLASIIGWKAANLSELELLGGGNLVPPWFVITDNAFQCALQVEIKDISAANENIPQGTRLNKAIEMILNRIDLTNKEKSFLIANLWERISLPGEIKKDILQAYCELMSGKNHEDLYAALRSSSCEEDAEIAARAGEFETFLFIKGEESVLDYIKRTWAGLWTERAIHNRSVMGDKKEESGGGVIVQHMIRSRISGVIQTINVAKGDLKEIVINAGLGLGEGIVSGAAAADQIIVSKEGNLENGPLHFNYITADKSSQVIFNKKSGFGTVVNSTLYHQRFRPALEYVELCELVSTASKLESLYGYPLDIEFAIEGTKLWILQVRPVPAFLQAFGTTVNHYPLNRANEMLRRNCND